MSLVVFPFKCEDPHVVIRNVETAARHPRVSQVMGMGVEQEETYQALAEAIPDIRREANKPIELMLQERIGNKRPGKGDGMNTALRYFLDQTDHQRIHFYDADITSFNADWISKAEEAADFDYGVVRHYFPRARTDAMITWMITRTGFAMLWPRSGLSWIEQPLGGELLFTRPVVEALVSDERVQAQSDWGIDTLYTFVTSQLGFATYEVNMAEGKAHKLYGKLTDLRTMLNECFAAIQSLKNEQITISGVHRSEYPDVVPKSIAEKLGFDLEGTLGLLSTNWSETQESHLEKFSPPLRDGMLANRQAPKFGFMDQHQWFDAYEVFLEHYVKGDEDWEELLFKVWTVRVLQYATTIALCGYNFSQRHLHDMILSYRRKALYKEVSQTPETA